MRYKNIGITNSYTLSSSGISFPNLSNTSYFSYGNNVYMTGNITPNLNQTDRLGGNLTIGNNLTVTNQIIANNYYFQSAKTYSKVYWAHLSQIPYDPGTSDTYFSAADSFAYSASLSNSYRSATRINQALLSGSIITPAVEVPANEYLTVPIEILNNQKLKSVKIIARPGSGTIDLSLVRYSFSGGIATIMSATPLSKTSYSYDLDYLYQPTSDYSFVLFIKNTYGSAQYINRVVLIFEANNLFELIGIS